VGIMAVYNFKHKAITWQKTQQTNNNFGHLKKKKRWKRIKE
jgi:hypothetical protein